MMATPAVLIEMEGVLINDPVHRFWELISSAAGITEADLDLTFNFDLGDDFWRGKHPEIEFWRWLASRESQLDVNSYRRILYSRVYPLLGMHLLPRIGRQADTYVLSDRRQEWILPLVGGEDIGYLLKGMYFSDHTGLVMTDEELWRRLARALPRNRLLVHRNPAVGKIARRHGFTFIQADPKLEWAEKTAEWLDARSAALDWMGWIQKTPGWLARISRKLR